MDPLAAMKQLNQWITVGRDKVPTQGDKNPHNPVNWLSYQEAKGRGPFVGFVFTNQDPFFFLDVDKCWDGKAWNSTASWACSTFAGCAVEVSMSGTGLHVFGTLTRHIPHSCRAKEYGMELYTSGRFAIVTESCITGSCSTVADGPFAGIVSGCFPPKTGTGDAAAWTTTPDPEWSGPEDDEALIRVMLSSRSSRASMGFSASIRDLWDADADALGKVYPDPRRPFDWSAADAALCNHLAFWTGKNCDRMKRLFERSGLVRDKWLDREDYQHATILGAVGSCKAVFRQRVAPGMDGDHRDEGFRAGVQLMTANQQLEYFTGCVYVRDPNRIFAPDGALINREKFNAMYGGYDFALDAMNVKTTRYAWEAFLMNQTVRFPKVIGSVFRPELKPGEIIDQDGLLAVNTYVPAQIKRVPGDVSLFLHHLAVLLPDPRDREILLSYMAACVQRIGEKWDWCPMIQGVEGNGKTFLAYCMMHAIGKKYFHTPNAADLNSRFTGWLQNKLFLAVEEIEIIGADRDRINFLKALITNRFIEIQAKGQDQYTGDNRANLMCFTNPKNAVPKTQTDRRFAILYTAQQTKEDIKALGPGYFNRLYGWAEAGGYQNIAHYLSVHPLDPELAPCYTRTAPVTSSTGEAMTLSLGALEQEILEAVEEGRPGFMNGWISSIRLNELFGRKIHPSRIKSTLETIGYDYHPALTKGRVNNPVIQEGGKPALYVHASRMSTEQTPEEARQAYLKAQEYEK